MFDKVKQAHTSLTISHTSVGPVLKERVRCLEHEVIGIIGVWKFVETPIRKILVAENGLILVPMEARAERHLESECGN